MFSEYASRFLAQSQSRVAYGSDNNQRNGPHNQRRTNQASQLPTSRSYFHRAIGNPYQPAASHISPFPFASRVSTRQAPLFHSATDEFREEDDEQEHEREIADFYALQRSRRHFGASQLEESSEIDDDGKGSEVSPDGSVNKERGFGRRRGIRSSWRGGKSSGSEPSRIMGVDALAEQSEGELGDAKSQASSTLGKDKLVEVGLDNTLRSDLVDIERDEPPDLREEGIPATQQFRKQSGDLLDHLHPGQSFLPGETDKQTLLDNPRPPSSQGSSVPPSMAYADTEPPQHDAFWGNFFLISLAGLFATAFLVYFHTSIPNGKHALGDTIYSTLHASFFLLAIYTLVSILVSLLWLALLRSYVRPLVYGILIAVPVILYAFSLYPFISSFKGTGQEFSIQDKAMRWGSLIPATVASAWIYVVIQGRHSTEKAISILEFSCRILSANVALVVFGFVTLITTASWTWLWILMFARVFLGGHLSASKNMFVINPGSWWLGVYFILVYIWSLGVIAGIQRTVTAATVSQWYFHRLTVPAPSSRQVVQAALVHAFTTLFGTVCLSTLLVMLIRLPLIVLPRRLSSFVSLAAYSLIPTPITALTNPLTLTYGAIHSQPLAVSARSLGHMTFLIPSTAATSFHPRCFSASQRNESGPLLPYRLAKLLLHATRFIMSLSLGFGGWVSTARNLQISHGNATARGSLYAYVVGFIAGAIGWGVLSAMEGILSGVVDAAVVCWASEVSGSRREARYCREAGWLFGGRHDDGWAEA